MSSSTWEGHMNAPNSYSYVPSEHGSGKKSNIEDGDGYASPPSMPRDYSDQGSVKGYGSGVKGYGSNIHLHHDTAHGSHESHNGSLKDFNHYGNGGGDHRGDEHDSTRFSNNRNGSNHSSVKEFGSDHGSSKNIGDTRGSSDCGYGNHETHQDSDYVSNPKGFVRLGMSWLDRRSFHMGDPCALPLDWDHHPFLRQVPLEERQNYRHAKLEEWLSPAHKRRAKETFGAYIWRASALANSELRHRKKQCWGDEYTDPLDKFVMNLFYGMKLKLERLESVVLGVEDETSILDILREECEELNKSGELPIDQRSIRYTPLMMSEMHERSANGRY